MAIERNGAMDATKVSWHIRNQAMFDALTCTQPNIGPNKHDATDCLDELKDGGKVVLLRRENA